MSQEMFLGQIFSKMFVRMLSLLYTKHVANARYNLTVTVRDSFWTGTDLCMYGVLKLIYIGLISTHIAKLIIVVYNINIAYNTINCILKGYNDLTESTYLQQFTPLPSRRLLLQGLKVPIFARYTSILIIIFNQEYNLISTSRNRSQPGQNGVNVSSKLYSMSITQLFLNHFSTSTNLLR